MIPRDYITQWRERAPWSEDFQVEQDLIISRALVAVYSDPVLAEALAFRGGTALYKLYLTPPARYSEDIDLVQVEPGPAGPLMDRLRSALDPWLGKARWNLLGNQRELVHAREFASHHQAAQRVSHPCWPLPRPLEDLPKDRCLRVGPCFASGRLGHATQPELSSR